MRKKHLIAITLCLTISVISTLIIFGNHNSKQTIHQQKNSSINVANDKVENNKTSDTKENDVPTSTDASTETKANSKNLIATISSDSFKKQNKFGNLPSNILNGGLIAAQDSWIYYNPSYSKYRNGIYKAMADGLTGLQKISNNSARCLNVIGSWIYYIDFQQRGIWKVETNGKNEQQLTTDAVDNLIVVDDTMYFVGSNGNNNSAINFVNDSNNNSTNTLAIYKAKTDASNQTKITDGAAFTLSDDGNWIFFSSSSNPKSSSLYKIKTDGTELSKIADRVPLAPFYDENNLYFYQLDASLKFNETGPLVTQPYDFNLMRLDSKGKQQMLYRGLPSSITSIHNGYLYFCSEDNHNTSSSFIYKALLSKANSLIPNKVNNKKLNSLYTIYFLNNKTYAIDTENNSFSIYCIDENGATESFNRILK